MTALLLGLSAGTFGLSSPSFGTLESSGPSLDTLVSSGLSFGTLGSSEGDRFEHEVRKFRRRVEGALMGHLKKTRRKGVAALIMFRIIPSPTLQQITRIDD